jgi:hypothetical protein
VGSECDSRSLMRCLSSRMAREIGSDSLTSQRLRTWSHNHSNQHWRRTRGEHHRHVPPMTPHFTGKRARVRLLNHLTSTVIEEGQKHFGREWFRSEGPEEPGFKKNRGALDSSRAPV